MQNPEKENDNPLWQPKGLGLGWTLNFNNKWSYLVLFIIIALIIGVIYFGITAKA